jgi:ABC-type transport system substrate-binding protein
MALADECHVTRDQIVDCHVRRGAKFHDGSPVTPEDVRYSLDYWADHRRAWIRQRHGLATLRSVEIVDSPRSSSGGVAPDPDPGRWIQITFAEPEPLALEHLAAIKVVPEKRHRGRSNRFARDPIGSGPMRVVELEQDRMVLERVSADEWDRTDRPLPAPERIVLRAVNDGAEALTLLRRGQVHVLPSVSPAHVPVELGKPGMAARFRAWVRSPARFDVLLWNLGHGLIANDGLRRALHLAVPRARVVVKAHAAPDLDIDAPVDLHTPQEIDLRALVDATADDAGIAGLPRAPDPLADVQGLVAAQALLDGLGWKMDRGLRRKPAGSLRINLMWDGSTGPGSSSADTIRDAWRSIGVVTPYAIAPWSYLLSLIKKGSYEVALVQLADHDDADLYHHYHSRGELNYSGVRDARLDQALEAYRAAPDLEARHAAERTIAGRLAALRVTTVLFAPAPVMLASNRVAGVVWIDDLPRLDALRLEAVGEGGNWQVE